jgi:hypothetical protein
MLGEDFLAAETVEDESPCVETRDPCVHSSSGSPLPTQEGPRFKV